MGEDELQVPSPIVEGLGEADLKRLTELVHSDQGRIWNIVRTLCGPQVDSDGVVAEAIARAVERLSAGHSIRELRPWVTTTAVNLGRSEIRRQLVRRRYAPLLVSTTRSEDADDTDVKLDVQQALRGLPRRQSEVVALYYGLDLSVSEIASALGRSEGTVKATLFKARKNLEVALGQPEGGDHGE